MNLGKKRSLAARTFKVGKEKIIFVKERLEEIKEAITKQDMRDLRKDGAIKIKEIAGRRSKKKKKRKRKTGNIEKKVNKRKKEYVRLTRKLRGHIKKINREGKLSREEIKEIRKKIRNKYFRSKANLKEIIGVTKR